MEVLPSIQGQVNPSTDNLPEILDLIPMDGTSVIEISLMQNQQYAPEILQRIMNSEHMKDILSLREMGDVSRVLYVGKTYILEICRDIDSLKTHTAMFVVFAMIKIGMILNEVYEALGKDRSKYSIWVRKNFGSHHVRYFQQSRQLVAMGEFAIKYSALGKNRLLQWDRIESKSQYKEIIDQHPYPDITEDRKGLVFKEHTDAAITLYNLKQEGIDFADFDQSYILATTNKQWVDQKTAKKIREWLNKFPTPEERRDRFDDYVLNRGRFPSDAESQLAGNLQSLNTIMANLISYHEKFIRGRNREWMMEVNPETFEKGKVVMRILINKTIPVRNVSAITANLKKPSAPKSIRKKPAKGKKEVKKK